MNEHFLAAIDSHLERIAIALEALATERNRAAAASRLAHLEHAERSLDAVQAELDAFKAAHPEIVALSKAKPA